MATNDSYAEQSPLSSPRGGYRFLLILLITALVAVFFELGRMDVISDNEGQRATPPLEMLRSGDFVVPTINGQDYLVKPPLLYWAIAAVYSATGTISEWTARTPTALAAVLAIICLYLCIRREAGERTARWAAVTLLASPYFLERARWADVDIPLTLTTMLAILALRTACLSEGYPRRILFTVLSGLSLGAAAMLKGPPPFLFFMAAWMALQVVEGTNPTAALRVGIVWSVVALVVAGALLLLQLAQVKLAALPIGLVMYAIVWFVLALRHGRETRWRDFLMLVAAMVIALGVMAPWALEVLSRKGWPYISAMLNNQVLERTGTATRINSGSPLYYWILPGMLAPWGLLLPLHFARREWRENGSLYRFSLVAGWLSVGVYSLIAGKEYEYILPAVPFLLIATGFHLSRFQMSLLEGWALAWMRLWAVSMRILFPVLIIGGAIYFAVAERRMVLTIEAAVIALVALAVLVRTWPRRSAHLGGIATMALLAIVLALVGRSFHYTEETGRSPKPLALVCQRLIDSGYPVETNKRTNFQDAIPYPAFSFYLRRNIPLLDDPAEIRKRLAQDSPYFFLALQDFTKYMGDEPGLAKVRVVSGPYTSKHMVLFGNTDPKLAP